MSSAYTIGDLRRMGFYLPDGCTVDGVWVESADQVLMNFSSASEIGLYPELDYSTVSIRNAANLLRAAILDHHSQKADDRCVKDDDRLYAAAGLPPCDRRVGNKAEMLANCARFIERRCEAGGWPSYSEIHEMLTESVKAIGELILLGEQTSAIPLTRERAILDRANKLLSR